MTNKHAFFSACALAIALAVSPAAANAQEYGYGEPVNHALGAQVGELLPEEVRSDTLAAVNDGLRYPQVPHSSGGPNPYAWTNFKSVQTRFTPGGGFYLDFGRDVIVDSIVIYQFVDSYSASLPEEVRFFTERYGTTIYPAVELVSSEQLSSTCWKLTFQLTGERSEREMSRLSVFEREAAGPGDKVVDRCVGVYEIEVFGPAIWQTDTDFDIVSVEEETAAITRAVIYNFLDEEGNYVRRDVEEESVNVKRLVTYFADGRRELGVWTFDDGSCWDSHTFPAIELGPVPAGYTRDTDVIPELVVTPFSGDMYSVFEVNHHPVVAPDPGADQIQEGWYRILCASNSAFSLDVNGASASDKTNIQIYRANDSAAQRFYITPAGDGFYSILTGASGLASAVDVTGNGKVNGTNIIQFRRNYAEAQAWTIERNEDGSVSFYAKGSGLALDFAGARAQNFTNVALWARNGSAAQRFMLVSID